VTVAVPIEPGDGVMFGWLSQGAASGASMNVTVPGETPYTPSAVGMPVMVPPGVTTMPGGIRLGLVTVNVVAPAALPGNVLDTGWLTVPFSSRLGTSGPPAAGQRGAAAADPAAGPASAMAASGGTASHHLIPVSLSRLRVMLSPVFAIVCGTRGASVRRGHDHLE
jgi:hypothetical protein